MAKLYCKDEISRKKLYITWVGEFENIVVTYGDQVIGRFENKQAFEAGKAFNLDQEKQMTIILKQKYGVKYALVELDGRKMFATGLLARIISFIASNY